MERLDEKVDRLSADNEQLHAMMAAMMKHMKVPIPEIPAVQPKAAEKDKENAKDAVAKQSAVKSVGGQETLAQAEKKKNIASAGKPFPEQVKEEAREEDVSEVLPPEPPSAVMNPMYLESEKGGETGS